MFLLLIAGYAFRAWRRSKRHSSRETWKQTRRSARWYVFRLSVTSVVAFVIALIVPNGLAALVWVVLWAGLYWLWKLWDRWRGKGIANPADEPTPTSGMVPEPTVLRDSGTRPLFWRRIVRKTVTVAAGAFVFIVGMAVVMVLGLGYYSRQVKAERDKVQMGMTVDQVLPLVHGGCIRTHAVLPDDVSDEEGVHYASLTEQKDGTFGSSSTPDHQWHQLTEAEALAFMKQKMSDGYEWRWRYTFINDTPQHFSFTVTFGRDGRVKEVTDVWGWD